jgi:succinate-semialdehyde dehydrogenase/glutarate-semialdehyde dehydrogenase
MTRTVDAVIREVRNPANGQIVGEQRDSTPAEVDEALAVALGAQIAWARTPRHHRAAVMRKYAALAREESEQLANSLSREQGKPLAQSLDEIALHCRLFEGFADRVLAMEDRATVLDNQPNLERDMQFTRHEPLGVVAGIIPFNFPVELFAHKVAPSIATGNSIVIKPSEETPLTTKRLVALLHEAGVPEGVVQIVYGGGDVGRILVGDPRVAAVTFTGSTEAGVDVAVAGARTLKSVVLELGGNDAMVVLEDADIDLVLEQAVFGRTLSNGQCCCANKRLLVNASVYDEVVDRLAGRFEQLVLGDPLLDGTQLGPLITNGAASRVLEQVQHSVNQGANLRSGGSVDGAYFQPTVLSDVRPDMDVALDMEIFGPVVALMPVKSDAEAIGIANATCYGLSGSVFTRDIERAMAVATQMQTGQVVVNGTGLYRSDVMAFGGYKKSGNGREGLGVSLEEYVQTKTITLAGVLPDLGK